MIDLKVENSIDANNGQSAAKTLNLSDMGKVQRLEGNLVGSSEPKCTAVINLTEDIVSSVMKVTVTNREYYLYALLMKN